jgi:hypothetical protein
MAPARAFWKGYLKLSLVSCPIALYAGTASTERVSFRQINKKTGHRLRQQLVDEVTREPVEAEAKGRGYEYAKNAYISVDDDELDARPTRRSPRQHRRRSPELHRRPRICEQQFRQKEMSTSASSRSATQPAGAGRSALELAGIGAASCVRVRAESMINAVPSVLQNLAIAVDDPVGR